MRFVLAELRAEIIRTLGLGERVVVVVVGGLDHAGPPKTEVIYHRRTTLQK